MRHMKKVLCAAVAAMMLTMGTSCDTMLTDILELLESTGEETSADLTDYVPGGSIPEETNPTEDTIGEEQTEASTVCTHEYGEWVIDCEPLVGVEGKKHRTCTLCGSSDEAAIEMLYSQGLAFVSNGDGTCKVAGIGTCTDATVAIPSVSPDEEAVTDIGYSAFLDCTSVTAVVIGKGVTTIGDYAFRSCTSLTSVTFPDSITSIGNSSFFGCDGLTSITLPDSVTNICEYAFARCKNLTSIHIPAGVRVIEPDILLGCVNLTEIDVAKENPVYHSAGNCLIETASKTLLAGCKDSRIPHDGSVTVIGDRAFDECSRLTSIEIPDTVTRIGNRAFSFCTSLSSIVIPDSVTETGEQLFYGCGALTEATLSGSLTILNSYMFQGCEALTTIRIPDSVTYIGKWVFRDCGRLASVYLSDNVTDIDERAFSGCCNLVDIYYSGTESQWNAISKGEQWNYDVGVYNGGYTVHYN